MSYTFPILLTERTQRQFNFFKSFKGFGFFLRPHSSRQLGIDSIQQKLGTIKLSDISGTANLAVGNVEYSLTGMQIGKIGLGNSALGLVPGTGVKLSVANGFINMHGNWEVKYFWFIKLSGSFELSVSELAISTNIAVKSDATGRPTISIINCAATVGSVSVRFGGGPRKKDMDILDDMGLLPPAGTERHFIVCRRSRMDVLLGRRVLSVGLVSATLDPDAADVSQPRSLLSSPLVRLHQLDVFLP
ncbi:Lipopolysaccharide-binding protein [Anabarilius grahami]|uniref:Bactericidal permeability-increasing protein n=1 Tax=Anabarilius grahami TaxID=495550 RepID=A0A3N0Y1E6_ANAGA|nr:Lipopolysaccharide-binding protein [Anabarilius grahami]